MENLKRTPLYNIYSQYPGIKLVDFGGWELPIQFSRGILHEHNSVRNECGIFDVSHMGEISIEGRDAPVEINNLVTVDISNQRVGQAKYTPMCNGNGGTVDDILVYKRGDTDFLLVVNAANAKKDYEWISGHVSKSSVTDRSEEYGQIALQGPKALGIIRTISDTDFGAIKRYHFIETEISSIRCIISRTGYTGEDGFELYSDPSGTRKLWEMLIHDHREGSPEPCGLGARDSLRFEASMPLYGHELSDTVSPLETGLKRFVNLEKEHFIGKEGILETMKSRDRRTLVGCEMIDPGVPREGYPVLTPDGTVIGSITTGMKSPTLGRFLGMALVRECSLPEDGMIITEIRGKQKRANIIPIPFYSKRRKK